jgi:transposase-like protein
MNEHHYQRIDKGIRRTRKSVPRRRDPETNALQAIPEGLQASEVLNRYLSDATTSEIAREYGVSRKSLTAWLRQTAPEAWKQALIIRAHSRKDDADEQIERAEDPLSLARAREMLKSGQWDLERLDAANYAQKQEVAHTGNTPMFSVTIISASPEKEINPK